MTLAPTKHHVDGIQLELFRHRFTAIAEEMGELLTRAAFSPNIKERRDHSCAIFDHHGDMIAQAAHIPVHLGAAPLCVKATIAKLVLSDRETAIVNDPFAGGTHLPDITLVTAVDLSDEPEDRLYVATRAHHADVGGIAPGSLPPSKSIDDEGWRCPPVRLTDAIVDDLLQTSRTPAERRGDLDAQVAANRRGCLRLRELAQRHDSRTVRTYARELQNYAATLIAHQVAQLPDQTISVDDHLDNANGAGPPIRIALTLTVSGNELIADFTGSDDQVEGPMNAVRAIVESAVFYVLCCLGGPRLPANSGVMRVADIRTRRGSVVDATFPAAVAAGNVETSQRLVDVLMHAFAELLPDRFPASSCGSMNNVLVGSRPNAATPFVYYETIGGGSGAGPTQPGASAIQTHMTNTLNTPIEALEHAFPMRVVKYAIRPQSGGKGQHHGGDGIERQYVFTQPAVLSIIAERRIIAPPGAAGGGAGCIGEQILIGRDGPRALPSKCSLNVDAGDRLIMRTPGGGGWGTAAS